MLVPANYFCIRKVRCCNGQNYLTSTNRFCCDESPCIEYDERGASYNFELRLLKAMQLYAADGLPLQ
jgi:hypothetical protein